jgi:hypothetical protein
LRSNAHSPGTVTMRTNILKQEEYLLGLTKSSI